MEISYTFSLLILPVLPLRNLLLKKIYFDAHLRIRASQNTLYKFIAFEFNIKYTRVILMYQQS